MPGPPLGIFVKSSLPSSFCSLKQNGTMVGGNHLQCVLRQPLPQFFLVPFFAHRGREDVFRGSKPGPSISSSER